MSLEDHFFLDQYTNNIPSSVLAAEMVTLSFIYIHPVGREIGMASMHPTINTVWAHVSPLRW